MTITASDFGSWGAVLLLLANLVVAGLGQWQLSALRRQEERQAADLASTRSILEMSVSQHSDGQVQVQQHRFDAALELWDAAIRMRNELGMPVFVYGILMPSEYDQVLLNPENQLAGMAALFPETEVSRLLTFTNDLEKHRPLVGEQLWLHFYIYRAFLGRLATLISLGIRDRHFADWRLDVGVRQLIGYVLPRETVDRLLDTTPALGDPQVVVSALEAVVLEDIRNILSGKEASKETMETALHIRAGIDAYEREAKKQQKGIR